MPRPQSDRKSTCWCQLLIAFASFLDPDQAQQIVGPDLDPNSLILSLLVVFLKEFFENIHFEEKTATKYFLITTQHAKGYGMSHMSVLTLSTNQDILSCLPRATVTSWFVYKVIRDLESIDHLCINPICRIGLIHK